MRHVTWIVGLCGRCRQPRELDATGRCAGCVRTDTDRCNRCGKTAAVYTNGLCPPCRQDLVHSAAVDQLRRADTRQPCGTRGALVRHYAHAEACPACGIEDGRPA